MTPTTAGPDLTWLLNDLVSRAKETQHAIVLSADGLLVAASDSLPVEDAEHLAAVASGIHSLAKGAGLRHGGGAVRQSIIEMECAYLLVSVAGPGSCLAVQTSADADTGFIAYEMATLVGKVSETLSTPTRPPSDGDAHA